MECTFGILKGRFRVLKSGIRMSGTECADNIFLTCCALHNWLLEIDGLDVQWREGAASDWEGETFEIANETTSCSHDDRNSVDGDVMTMDDTSTVTAGASVTAEDVPDAIFRLHHPMARRDGICTTENVVDNVDNVSDDGEVGLMEEEEEPLAVETVGGITCVRTLSLDFFRSKLVTHFDIAYKRNEVKWPRRMKSRRPATNL